MKKQEYLDLVAHYKGQIKKNEERLAHIKNEYVEANKPCEIDTLVKITRQGGRVSVGNVKGFGILQDKGVYVTAIKNGSKPQTFISVPYESIEILKQLENE